MPDPTLFPMDFRPTDYTDGLPALLSRIKGTRRRQLAEAAAESGRLDDIPAALLGESVPRAIRRPLEAADFQAMGGEYLPGLDGWIEIARVEMPTTSTGDVVSVRAKPTAKGYRYKVEDEHGAKFTSSPRWARLPLTLGHLIGLIDSATCTDEEEDEPAGIFDARYWAVCNGGEDPEEYLDFYRVTSPFYPDLRRWYDEEAAEWVAERRDGE